MYSYRRILEISYRGHITNAEILNRISKEAEFGKGGSNGHVHRQPAKYQLVYNVLNVVKLTKENPAEEECPE